MIVPVVFLCGFIAAAGTATGGQAHGPGDTTDAALFATIQRSPTDWAARRRLAERYEQQGFDRTAEVFAATVTFAQRGTLRYRSAKPTGIGCPEPAERQAAIESTSHEIARTVSNMTPGDNVEGVLRLADDAIRTDGPVCRLLTEWSRVVLLDQTGGRPKTGAAAAEKAFRTLIELADKEGQYPIGLEGTAAVYAFLADDRSLHRDYVTADVLIEIALKRLLEGSATGSEERKSFEASVRQRATRLRALATKQSPPVGHVLPDR
jgi:hypothetical protein